MTELKARQIVLASRPQGRPQLTDFRLEETAIPTPGPGQVLLQVQYLVVNAVGECRHVVGVAGSSRG
jgi:NADPH-dependent curcumin reductase CurA